MVGVVQFIAFKIHCRVIPLCVFVCSLMSFLHLLALARYVNEPNVYSYGCYGTASVIEHDL